LAGSGPSRPRSWFRPSCGLLIVAAAFGAALLATAATGITSRAWLIILLSVVLSQIVGSGASAQTAASYGDRCE
jgi:hypothetical protein